MPSKQKPITELGEASVAQLAMRLLDHDRLVAQDLSVLYPAGRHSWLPLVGLRHAHALVDLVAVAENFAATRLRQLHTAVPEKEVSSWEKRRRAWNKHDDVDLTSITPNWHKLMGFVEARNAFQHGLGRLTEMQLGGTRRGDVLSDLAIAGVSVVGDLIQVEAKTVKACHSVCEEFVLALDNKATLAATPSSH